MERHDMDRRRFFGMLGKAAGAATAGAVVFGNGRAFSAVLLPQQRSVRGVGGYSNPTVKINSSKPAVNAAPASRAMAGAVVATAPAADVVAYFGDLKAGSMIADWQVVSVHATHLGAVPVVLATKSGERFQVDVLKRDPRGPSGVAETGSVALFLTNGGKGSKRTDSEMGLGALALATALKAREKSGAQAPKLLSFKDRGKRHPNGEYKLRVG